MAEKVINIGGRLHDTSSNHTVTGANEILDDDLQKKQSEINREYFCKYDEIYSIVGDKEYELLKNSGMGRINLPQNPVGFYTTWMFLPSNGNVYLLYSPDGSTVYGVYDSQTGKGLGFANNIIVEIENYETADLPSIVDGHYLSYTEDDGVYTITLPDESTITSTDLNPMEIFRFQEGGNYFKNILTHEMISEENTIYIIQYDYDLNGQIITVPEGCVLEFDGGSINGSGNIVLQNTQIEGDAKLYVNVSGTLKNDVLYVRWFGLVSYIVDEEANYPENPVDNSLLYTRFTGIDLNRKTVMFDAGDYNFESTMLIQPVGNYPQDRVTYMGTEIKGGTYGTRLSIRRGYNLENIDETPILHLKTRCNCIKNLTFQNRTILDGIYDTTEVMSGIGLKLAMADDHDEPNDYLCNIDSKVQNCLFSGLRVGVDVLGRQVEIHDCNVSQCNIGFRFDNLRMPDQSNLGGTGRGYSIKRCHFHGMADLDRTDERANSEACIVNTSPQCFDFHISDCRKDCEKSFFIGNLLRSVIENNHIHSHKEYFIKSNRIIDSIIIGNTVLGLLTDHNDSSQTQGIVNYEEQSIKQSVIDVSEGIIEETIISNNLFGKTYKYHICAYRFANLKICDNVFHGWGIGTVIEEDFSPAIKLIDIGDEYGLTYRNNLSLVNNTFFQDQNFELIKSSYLVYLLNGERCIVENNTYRLGGSGSEGLVLVDPDNPEEGYIPRSLLKFGGIVKTYAPLGFQTCVNNNISRSPYGSDISSEYDPTSMVEGVYTLQNIKDYNESVSEVNRLPEWEGLPDGVNGGTIISRRIDNNYLKKILIGQKPWNDIYLQTVVKDQTTGEITVREWLKIPYLKYGEDVPNPAATTWKPGERYFFTPSSKDAIFNGTKFVEFDAAAFGVKRKGEFGEKPSGSDVYIGFRYFCTNRIIDMNSESPTYLQVITNADGGIEITYKGQDTTDPDNPIDIWVDALGRIVS